MYLLGKTEEENFPLILTIGREPNYDDVLSDSIGKINKEEFSSMSGGVWVTAYTQFAKQYFDKSATSKQLKDICFEKNSSPIVFTNAFPYGIPHEIDNKVELREKLKSNIPEHIYNLFSKPIIERVELVVHHGSDNTETSALATKLIHEECNKKCIPYCSTPFFYNGNSIDIQESLKEKRDKIKEIFSEFVKNA